MFWGYFCVFMFNLLLFVKKFWLVVWCVVDMFNILGVEDGIVCLIFVFFVEFVIIEIKI